MHVYMATNANDHDKAHERGDVEGGAGDEEGKMPFRQRRRTDEARMAMGA